MDTWWSGRMAWTCGRRQRSYQRFNCKKAATTIHMRRSFALSNCTRIWVLKSFYFTETSSAGIFPARVLWSCFRSYVSMTMISRVISITIFPPYDEILQVVLPLSVHWAHFESFLQAHSVRFRDYTYNLISLTGASNRLTGDLKPLAHILGNQLPTYNSREICSRAP